MVLALQAAREFIAMTTEGPFALTHIPGESSGLLVKEADNSELVMKTVHNDEEAFEFYNEYAFRKGFSVRRGKCRKRADGTWSMRRFLCSNAGLKEDPKRNRSYENLDTRTNCGAFVQFNIDKNGVYTCVRHDMVHNHEMIPFEKRHLLRSQRKIKPEQLEFISTLKASGVQVSDAIRVLRKEAGGSPNVGFGARDVYNALNTQKKKELDGFDCKHLIKLFAIRRANEPDFFYEFELDDEGMLISFFWRDAKMKRDYEAFGDLVVFDTTYRTTKYGMICAPFVGMNHHCNNVMFGMGFVLNERIESFIWLFECFLSANGGAHPVTIMTDQSAAMAAAIQIVFPASVRHRLCTWHLGENSMSNISHLKALDGFNDLFNYLLKYCDTAAEFEHFWQRMLVKYKCVQNEWLAKLYQIKEKWCPAYSKDYFSGGILSSQRSETTNHSVSHRLKKTHGLCDFYHCFLDVISEWRSRENGQDFGCLKGNRHLAFANVSILEHGREVYTGQVYQMFEEQFVKGAACDHEIVGVEKSVHHYYVWRPKVDFMKHQVKFDKESHSVSCTCKYFSEVGLLCLHSLRVYHLQCVGRIPAGYIIKRWTKSAMSSSTVEELRDRSKVVLSSVWRAQTLRFLVYLVTSCQDIPLCRTEIEDTIKLLKERVESIKGGKIDFEKELEQQVIDISDLSIKDPPIAKKKYERNVRPKGAIEKARKQANAWRKRVGMYADQTKAKAQNSVQFFDPNVQSFIHPTSEESGLIAEFGNYYEDDGNAPTQSSEPPEPHPHYTENLPSKTSSHGKQTPYSDFRPFSQDFHGNLAEKVAALYSKKSTSSVPIGVSSSTAAAGQGCPTDSSHNLQTSSTVEQTSSIPQQTSSVTCQRPLSLNAHLLGNRFQRPQVGAQRPPIQKSSSAASHRPPIQKASSNVCQRPPIQRPSSTASQRPPLQRSSSATSQRPPFQSNVFPRPRPAGNSSQRPSSQQFQRSPQIGSLQRPPNSNLSAEVDRVDPHFHRLFSYFDSENRGW